MCTIHNIASSAQSAPQDYFPSLTGMRFFLALWVILHHLSGTGMMLSRWNESLPWWGQQLVRGGYLAVQTFFILSGFVLAQSYGRTNWDRTSLWKYAGARFARVYPVYVLSIIVVSPHIWRWLQKPGIALDTKSSVLASYLFVLQGWLPSANVGWNTPAWSLSCEFFFYLCFPALVLWLRDARVRKIAVVLAVCIVTPVFLSRMGLPWHWKPIYHIADFVSGICAARLCAMQRNEMKGHGWWLYVPALIAGTALILYPHSMYPLHADLNTALRPTFTMLIIGLAFGGGLLDRLLATNFAQYLGKISYAMYILHVPLLWWYGNLGPQWIRVSPLLVVAVYISTVVAVSAVAYELVEAPANRWIRDRVAARLKRTSEEPVAVAA